MRPCFRMALSLRACRLGPGPHLCVGRERNRPCDARLPLLPWPSASCSPLSGSPSQQAAAQAEARPRKAQRAEVRAPRREVEALAARGPRALEVLEPPRIRAPSARGRWHQGRRAPRGPLVAPPRGPTGRPARVRRMELVLVAAGRPEPLRARVGLQAPAEPARTPAPPQARTRGLARPERARGQVARVARARRAPGPRARM